MRLLLASAWAAAVLPLAACLDQQPAVEPPAGVPTLTATAAPPGPELPTGPLRELVPQPDEVPAGLLLVPEGTGPRDAAAVAGFSADPAVAEQDLAARGFTSAYAAQYAERSGPRALTVVAVRFATQEGAQADLAADLAESTGELVPVDPPVGAASEVRRLPLEGGLELVTVRFRSGATTWLVALRAAAPAPVDEPVELARALVARAG